MAVHPTVISRLGPEFNLNPAPPRSDWHGAVVHSFDGKRIGRVDLVIGDYLKIHRLLGRDFWIPDVLVRGARSGALVLHIDRSMLHRYRVH